MKIKTLMVQMTEAAMITICRIAEADDRRRRRSRLAGDPATLGPEHRQANLRVLKGMFRGYGALRGRGSVR